MPDSSWASETISFQQGVAPTTDYSHKAVEIRSGSVDHSRLDEELRTGSSTKAEIGTLRFLLAYSLDAIPANTVIEEASLHLTLVSVVRKIGDIQLFRVETDGSLREKETTWSRFSQTNAWTSPGGDFDPTVLSILSGFGNGKSGDRLSFPSTPNFAAAVQSAHDAGLPLVLLVKSEESEGVARSEFVRFASPRFTDPPTWRPELIVRYSVGSRKSTGGNR